MSPILPFEIEGIIFETAAFSRPKQVPTLMLVAWRVHQWVEPLLYRTLSIRIPPLNFFPMLEIPNITLTHLTHLIASKDATFLDAVRNVAIPLNMGKQDLERTCSAFPNIETLFARCPLRHPALPQLRRLHCMESRTTTLV
ncbi:hypothetical protein C8F01DRAFT_1252528 [Mycena amicta]|nr:hypothetical protein C8F01DRAFT_1252528 [Mycena amicta]